MPYVVWFGEHLKDEFQEGAKIVSTEEAALKCINDMSDGFFGRNMVFRLFELGNEIHLAIQKEEIHQPPIEKQRYVIRRERH